MIILCIHKAVPESSVSSIWESITPSDVVPTPDLPFLPPSHSSNHHRCSMHLHTMSCPLIQSGAWHFFLWFPWQQKVAPIPECSCHPHHCKAPNMSSKYNTYLVCTVVLLRAWFAVVFRVSPRQSSDLSPAPAHHWYGCHLLLPREPQEEVPYPTLNQRV